MLNVSVMQPCRGSRDFGDDVMETKIKYSIQVLKNILIQNSVEIELTLSHGCLSLAQIIEAFESPISEEFAWALCFQLAKCGQRILAEDDTRKQCVLLTSSAQLLVHKGGMVHQDSFLGPNSDNEEEEADVKCGNSRVKCSQEGKLLSNMAVVIFLALDHGLPDNLERIVSPELETLMDEMLCADGEARTDFLESDDRNEGQTGDHQGSIVNFSRIIQVCAQRMRKLCPRSRESMSVDEYSKAICRTYVAQALELYTFLAKVANFSVDADLKLDIHSHLGSENDVKGNGNLSTLGFMNWARHWADVLRDLREGVKLKKVFCRYQRIPPELTPYEILMEDIRSRRYNLKKTIVTEEKCRSIIRGNPNNPHRALIRELTRSRQTRLRKAADRILNPPPTIAPTPVEKLMESIIRQDHRLSHVKLPKINSIEEVQ